MPGNSEANVHSGSGVALAVVVWCQRGMVQPSAQNTEGNTFEGLMATAHLKECVLRLVVGLHDPDLDRKDLAEALAAAFELIDQPWEFTGAKDVLIWREGYEQCMQDIVDADRKSTRLNSSHLVISYAVFCL